MKASLFALLEIPRRFIVGDDDTERIDNLRGIKFGSLSCRPFKIPFTSFDWFRSLFLSSELFWTQNHFYLSKKKKIEAKKLIRKEMKAIPWVPVCHESSTSKIYEMKEVAHLSPGGLQYTGRWNKVILETLSLICSLPCSQRDLFKMQDWSVTSYFETF